MGLGIGRGRVAGGAAAGCGGDALHAQRSLVAAAAAAPGVQREQTSWPQPLQRCRHTDQSKEVPQDAHAAECRAEDLVLTMGTPRSKKRAKK